MLGQGIGISLASNRDAGRSSLRKNWAWLRPCHRNVQPRADRNSICRPMSFEHVSAGVSKVIRSPISIDPDARALVLRSLRQVERMIPGLLSQMRSRMTDTHLQSSGLGAVTDCAASLLGDLGVGTAVAF